MRERSRASRIPFGVKGTGKYEGHQKLLDDLDDPDSAAVDIELGKMDGLSLPPAWVDIVDTIKVDMSRIKVELTNLARLHNARLKVTFGEDEKAQDAKIDSLAAEITGLLRRSENRVKQIALRGKTAQDLSQEERLMRLNVMKAMAYKLRSLSKDFRTLQKDFLVRLKAREDSGKEFFDEETNAAFMEGDQELSEAQLAQLEDAKTSVHEREREIARIAQSINDLASIFRELSVLIVEQGSILDRIDYNVERSMEQVKEGHKEIIKAENWQKGTRSLWCIFFLLLAIIICIIIIVYRK